MKWLGTLGTTLLVLGLQPAYAADPINAADTAWMATATALVLFMTLPGLALFYAGLVQPRNVVSVLMHCFAIACLSSVLWFVVGYSLAFGAASHGLFGGLEHIFLSGISPEVVSGSIPELLFVIFQMTFAIITPALVVGSYVERVKFLPVLLFSGAWLLIVYAPVTHWVWGGGFLADMGTMDFAGGIVVHATAGVAAIVFALMLGRRRHFPQTVQPPHSPILTMIGASMLWVGWFGFNGGSALAANGQAASAMLVTHLAAATASLTWMIVEWVKFGKPSLIGIVTGMVAGLATVTPASGFIGPIGGMILGVAGGLVCYGAVDLIRGRWKLDDSLDVFAVHGVGGILGSIALPILGQASLGGALKDVVVMESVLVQLYAVLVVVIWTACVSAFLLYVISKFAPLRVSEEDEFEGLDITQHGERGYHGG